LPDGVRAYDDYVLVALTTGLIASIIASQQRPRGLSSIRYR